MEYEVVRGRYKYCYTRYYAFFANGKLVVSTRKRDLPRVDEEFTLPPRKLNKDAGKIVVGCPKCQKAHVYPRRFSEFYLDAVEIAKDCEEYKMFVEIYQTCPSVGWLVLDALKSGEKIGEIPQAMRRRLLKGEAIEVAKKLIDLNVLTDEARTQLLSLMLGK
jgi:hypothetical protein